MQHFLTLWREGGQGPVELVPDGPVLFRRSGQSPNAARLLHRVQGGEIAEFHCQTARCPPHLGRDLLNYGVAPVELAKGKLAVQIERDQEMITGPLHARGFRHVSTLPSLPERGQDEFGVERGAATRPFPHQPALKRDGRIPSSDQS